jgi:hypothetical protein
MDVQIDHTLSMERDPGWQWEDPRWPARVGDDVAALVNEALLRAVDLRDVLAVETNGLQTRRALMLVDVLNKLAAVLDS